MKRLAAGMTGGVLALATLIGASSTSEEGALVYFLSGGGVLGGLFLYWLVRGRHGHPWRWYHSVSVGIAGSVVLLVVFVALYNPGDAAAMGFAVGSGLGYGLILGASAALLVFAFDLPAPEGAAPVEAEEEAKSQSVSSDGQADRSKGS